MCHSLAPPVRKRNDSYRNFSSQVSTSPSRESPKMALQAREPAKRPVTGRPRRPETHAEILEAAQALLLEGGDVALSIEAVAVRAGVAKTTVYRRWPTRLALVAEVLAQANEGWPMPAPRGGSVHDDLLVLYRNWVAGIAGAGRVIPALIAAAIQNAELAELLQRSFVRPRRSLAIGIIESAVERGELPVGSDAATAIDMLMGRMWYRLLITGEGVRAEDETKVVDMLLDGLRHQRGSTGAA